MFATLGLIPLCWLLARLIWLPMYMGLFFFLVAGLLVGAISFRLARPARPLARSRIIVGSAMVALLGAAAFCEFEYLNFVDTVGEAPRFADAKNAALLAGRTARSVEQSASDSFLIALRERYPPGKLIGYVRWAMSGLDLDLAVDSAQESIGLPHQGFRWVARTVCAWLLLAIGLNLSFDALRLGDRVSNILPPGEPYEEEF